MKTLNIGDSLYKRLFLKEVAEYKIIGVRNYSDGTQYEAECQACSHGEEKCLVLIAQDKQGFRYITILNDEDEQQYYWHDDAPYYMTREEAHVRYLEEILHSKKEQLSKLKASQVSLEKEIKEMEVTLEELKLKAGGF